MNPSHNLFIIGPTGAGKSTVGRRLAQHYGLRFVDVDEEIERRTGVPITTIFEIEGEAGFRAREQATLAEFCQTQGVVLATGAGIVLDQANRQLLRQHGYVLWLHVGLEQQLERLARDHSRPMLAGDRRQRLQAMAPVREPLYRELAELTIPGDIDGINAATEQSIVLIDRHWQRPAITASSISP